MQYGNQKPMAEDERIAAAGSARPVCKHSQRAMLVAHFGDRQGRLFNPATYMEYLRSRDFRDLVAGPCHQMFGARCYACGLTARDADNMGERLTTAHIVYPLEPFTEVVSTDLTRSDVVLLCWRCHQRFDAATSDFYRNLQELREVSVYILAQMREELGR
jgi:hypothetical protein